MVFLTFFCQNFSKTGPKFDQGLFFVQVMSSFVKNPENISPVVCLEIHLSCQSSDPLPLIFLTSNLPVHTYGTFTITRQMAVCLKPNKNKVKKKKLPENFLISDSAIEVVIDLD